VLSCRRPNYRLPTYRDCILHSSSRASCILHHSRPPPSHSPSLDCGPERARRQTLCSARSRDVRAAHPACDCEPEAPSAFPVSRLARVHVKTCHGCTTRHQRHRQSSLSARSYDAPPIQLLHLHVLTAPSPLPICQRAAAAAGVRGN
jgi:hypothetical protein